MVVYITNSIILNCFHCFIYNISFQRFNHLL